MEAFSLLKYWKGGGGRGGGAGGGEARATDVSTTTTTAESDSDGPFFDLEFTLPSSDSSSSSSDEEEEAEEEEEEIKPEPEGENEAAEEEEDTGGSIPGAQSSLLKSATKFRVFLMGLKKPSPKGEEVEKQQKWGRRKLLTVVKLKVEEVPLFSSSSSRSRSQEEEEAEESKRFLKYIKKVKPLYVKVSKMRFVKGGGGGGGEAGKVVVRAERRREDDSLLEQQDGIQGAILHCKRSFNASSSSSSSTDSEVTLLPRSVSDPSHEKFTELLCRNASDSEAICARKASPVL